ncbi:MAG: hypothetical protein IIU76_04880 [Bacteroidales bacterium]|nr:hypothetical protein [Bacteroidales bacterium]
MGFDQFAGMLDDRMRAQKSLSTGSDTTNFQAWRANEYKKYAADPGNYTWTAMPDGYKASREEMRQLRAEGLLANRRGTGYYDPNDNSQAYIFGNKSWMQQHLDKGLDPTKRAYYFVDQHGNPVTNEQELAVAASHIKDPEIRKHFERYLNTEEMPTTTPAGTVTVQEQNVGKVGQSDFSKAMNAVQAGIVATAAAPVVVEATADAAKELGRYAYKAGKQMIQNGRSIYGRTPQMLQQNRYYT